MKVHGLQYGDGRVKIETGKTLPSANSFHDGRLFYLIEGYDKYPPGLYVYLKEYATWKLINEIRDLELVRPINIGPLTVTLSHLSERLGSTFATVIVSDDNEIARMEIKGTGDKEVRGFEILSTDAGKPFIKCFEENMEVFEATVWTTKNFNPTKLQPRSIAVDVKNNYMCSRSGENLFVDTTESEVIVKLPSVVVPGDIITVVDSNNSFSKNPCTINAKGQKINGKQKDLVLDRSGIAVQLIFQNVRFGWRAFKMEQHNE
jgi:hypothetical protein